MSELFVVGLSWHTAPVAVREKLAFRDDELAPTLRGALAELPVTEALLISTCNRVELYGVAKPGAEPDPRAFLAANRSVKLRDVESALYAHRGGAAIRHVFRVASSLDSLVVGEAQILGQLKAAYAVAGAAGTAGPVLSRALERAFGVAKRVRTETSIARGAANVSSVAVELARRVWRDLAGKRVLVVGAGKMSSLAAKHLYANGAQEIVVTNRSPERAQALADEIDAVAKPWGELEALLVAADVVISSTGAREPVLTYPMFKRVARARRGRPMIVIDIAVPRDAEPKIADLDDVYLYDIDDLDKVVKANLAERQKSADQAGKIVEHEAGQFEHWLRTQGVVPTIRALRTKLAEIGDAEVQKALDQLARREHSREQQRELLQRTVQLVVNKILHTPTTALRGSEADTGALRAEVLAELFGLAVSDEPEQTDVIDEPVETPSEKARA
ncbi:MAG TPA: glutamyl-tRNA reductase [Kofleriaceae bacterium]|jgi:glutamyl-tRNA reductase